MKKVLLTSGGISNSMQDLLFRQIKKEPNEIKVLYIPNAATHDDGARESHSLCMVHLLKMGMLIDNIQTYNLQYLLSKNYERTYSSGVANVPALFRLLTVEEMNEYDILLFGGGNASNLLYEINRTGFNDVVKLAVEIGLIYIGISAGSMVAAGNFENGLKYIENPIVVHCDKGTPYGNLPNKETIYLTDTQAIWIDGNLTQII